MELLPKLHKPRGVFKRLYENILEMIRGYLGSLNKYFHQPQRYSQEFEPALGCQNATAEPGVVQTCLFSTKEVKPGGPRVQVSFR